MAEVNTEKARAQFLKPVPQYVPHDQGEGLPNLPGDRIIIRRPPIDWNPAPTAEGRARVQLKQIESRIDKDLATLDQAISARQGKGGQWFIRFNDPVLRDLRNARSELAKARAAAGEARQALDVGRIPPDWIKDPIRKYGPAFETGGVGPEALGKTEPGKKHPPGIWNPPIHWGRSPDLDRAESRINDVLGRLSHAEHLLGGAYKRTDASTQILDEGDGLLAKRDPESAVHDAIGNLLASTGVSRRQAEVAREAVWEAQDSEPEIHYYKGSPGVAPKASETEPIDIAKQVGDLE